MTRYSKDLTVQISIAIETATPTMMMRFDAYRTAAATTMRKNRVNATINEVDPNTVAHRRRRKPRRHRPHIDLHRRMPHRRRLVSPLLPPRVHDQPSHRARHHPMHTSRRSKQRPANHSNSHLHHPSCIPVRPEHKKINSHANRTLIMQ